MKTGRFIKYVAGLAALAVIPGATLYAQNYYGTVSVGYNLCSNYIDEVNMCQGLSSSFFYPYNNGPAPFTYYGYSTATDQATVNSTITTLSTYQDLKQGFGGGAALSVSAGYRFSPYVSGEIGFSYLLGATLQSNQAYNYSTRTAYPDTTAQAITYASSLQSSPRYRIMPSLKLTMPVHRFIPYIKIGMMIDLGGTITLNNNYQDVSTTIDYGTTTNNTTNVNATLVATGGVSLGYTGAIGTEYLFKNGNSIYCEFSVINDLWSPDQANITSFSETFAPNNPSNTPTTLSNTSINYSDNVGTTQTGNISGSGNVLQVSNQYPRQIFSFSSYGFAIGIRFLLREKQPSSTPAPAPAPAGQ